MSIPKLHKCRECDNEGRSYIGHDEKWCRIKQPRQTPIANHQDPELKQSHTVQEDPAQQHRGTRRNEHGKLDI